MEALIHKQIVTKEERVYSHQKLYTGKPFIQILQLNKIYPIRKKNLFEKAYGAKQAGVKTIIIPKENEKDIPGDHLGLEVLPVETVDDALTILFGRSLKGDRADA